jgi:hypothetical protein
VTTAAALVAEIDRQAGVAARAMIARESEAEVADTLAEALALLLSTLTTADLLVIDGVARFPADYVPMAAMHDLTAALAAARVALDAHHELRQGAL